MALKKISIDKFKSIQSIEIPLKEITLLVGGNNNGKTSALQAIQFAVSAAQSVNLVGSDQGEWSSIAPLELMYVPAADPASVGPGGRLPSDKENPTRVAFTQEDDNIGEVKIAKGRNRNVIVSIQSRLKTDLGDINNPFSVYVPGLAGVAKQEVLCSMGVIKRAVSRGDANLYLRNVLWALKNRNPASWIEFQGTIKKIFPNLILNVQFDHEHYEFISTEFSNESTENVTYLPLECAGTGLLQILQIFSYLYLFKPQLLLLDEPDAHLHPNNQKAMIEELQKLCSKTQTQVLISTHSRHVLNAIGRNGKALWIDKGSAKDADERIIELLMEIGALDNYSTLAETNREWIIFTEDAKSAHLKRILDAGEIQESLYGQELVSFKGCKNVHLVNILSDFARLKNPKIKSLVILDRDFLSPADLDEIKSKMEKFGHICIFTKDTDIESYYTTPEHINAIYPEIDTKSISELLQNLVQENSLSIKTDYVNWMQDYDRQNKPNEERRSAGALLELAENKFNASPLSCIQGKSLAKLLHQKLQDLGFKPANLFRSSKHLRDEEIMNVLSKKAEAK